MRRDARFLDNFIYLLDLPISSLSLVIFSKMKRYTLCSYRKRHTSAKRYTSGYRPDHCLDLIRQALMCRADTSLMTFHWEAGSREPMLKLESPEHDCVDWEDLMQKPESRRVSDAEMAMLVNPSMLVPVSTYL
ncbi:hypothetical protein F5Y18DRAFT_381936 [Xylariaceae sp. FL1019]|nr:hypothetical protein F5Y18DRAFT_381936 [Xylariaceae sp. FL1019]